MEVAKALRKSAAVSSPTVVFKKNGTDFPYTIVRATQFFKFIDGIAQFKIVGQTVHLQQAWQPMAVDDVASALAKVTLDNPLNGMIEIAGPARAGLDELVGRFLGAAKDPREVITDVDAHYYGLAVNDQLTPGANPRIGATSFEDWLNRYIAQTKISEAGSSAPNTFS